MSTNYYFVPKKIKAIKDTLDNLYKEYTNKLETTFEEYKDRVREIIDKANKDKSISLLRFEDVDEYFSRQQIPYVWNYELPEIHIGKYSYGWVFLFEANEHFETFEQIKKFYENNKENFDVTNEYGEIVDFNELEKDVIESYENKENQSHIEYLRIHGPYYISLYSKDNNGYEFSHSQFS